MPSPMSSLAELAKRARAGQKVSGGTEVASATRGVESFYSPQKQAMQSRGTIGDVSKAAAAPTEGLNEKLKRSRAAGTQWSSVMGRKKPGAAAAYVKGLAGK